MSWSIKLHNGDFATEAARFSTVTKEGKLVQDLRLHLLEALGTDNLHPNYGSQIEDVIGETDLNQAVLEVESEITRVALEQQQAQLERAKQDRFTFGKATLDPGEILVDIGGIQVVQNQDKLNIQVTLITGNEEEIGIEVPITTDTQLDGNTS